MAQLRTKKAMAKLILSMDGLVLKEIPLLKERVSIGRKAHNDIQIDNMAISGEHAAVVTILNDSFLEDLNSTNGTLVNGQPVKKHFLKDGDVIELGKYKMKYIRSPVVTQNEVSPYDQTTQPPRSAAVCRRFPSARGCDAFLPVHRSLRAVGTRRSPSAVDPVAQWFQRRSSVATDQDS
jgi:pSer/pThr/pTyr-binding forkhead associated (FHA) protein